MTAGSPKAGSRTSARGARRSVQTASPEGPAERPAGSTAHPGQRLPVDIRGRMEPVVGGDLSEVMIHHGPTAGALATTQGRDATFASGVYRPGTPIGEAVLAHELAHTRQQSGPSASALSSDALERQADQAGYLAAMRLLDPAAAARLAPPTISGGQGLQLQRCSAPTYPEIRGLPTREEYEQRGELLPRGYPALTNLGPDIFSGFAGGSLDLPGARPGRATPAPPQPAMAVEAAAPVLDYEQLVARLDILEARQERIAATIPDLDQ